MSPRDAMQRAEEVGLDLVEVSPNAKPPVCKIMDYGKVPVREKQACARGSKETDEGSSKRDAVPTRYCRTRLSVQETAC